MADESLTAILSNPQQGHSVMSGQLWPWAKNYLQADRPVVVELKLLEDVRSIQRNKEYWGFVLRPISEQALVNGMGADSEGWHLYYKRMFLGYEFTKVRLPGAKRPSVTRALKSTTNLPERVMRKYLEKVRAHAATTFGVEFPALPMDLQPPSKPTKAQSRATTVDAETGEILELT